MQLKTVLPIEADTLQALDAILAKPFADDDYTNDSLIIDFTATFSGGYEVDIKVVNGDDYAGAYIDAVIFHNGQEVFCLEPAFDKLEGEYIFDIRGNQYIVEVVCKS